MAIEPRTTDSRSPHELLQRLRALRAVGTVVATLAGICQAFLAIAAVILLVIGIDWLLRLPGPLRLAMTLSLAVLVALLISRCVVARLRRLPLDDVARQVQDGLDGPPDCLASGAEFAAAGLSEPFAERTIRQSADLSRRLSLIRFVRWRWMSAWLTAAFLAAGVLSAAWPSIGWWVRRGFERLAWPAEKADWPRRVQIVSELSGQTVLAAAGEPVNLAARITRGSSAIDARLVLEDAGQVRRLDMADIGEGRRSVSVRLLGSATFWFDAGDDDTRATPGRIRVVARPGVSKAQVLVQPPPYTSLPADRITLGSGPVQVPEGSRIDLQIAVSKPLAGQDSPYATVTISPADAPAAQPVESLEVRWGDDRQQIAAGWWCTRDSLVRAEFTDTEGFASAPLQPWRVAAQADQPPAVQLDSPADALEVTPAALLQVQAAVTDDYGIDDVRLAWHVSRAATTQPSADTQPSSEQLQRLPAAQSDRTGQSANVSIDWPWTLEPLALQPGDRVTWSLLAQDNFDLNARRHPPVRTPPRTLRIVSESTLLESVLEQLGHTRDRIAQMARRQRDIRESVLAHANQSDTADSASLQQAARRQAQLAAQASTTAAELDAVARRLRGNRVEQRTLPESVSDAARQLAQLQSNEMADVQRNLQPAAGSADLPAAARSADSSARGLEDLLQRTSGWTSLESAALALQNLIDRQKALQAETAELAAKTLGRPADQLPSAQRDALSRVAENQRALADRLGQLQQDMNRQSDAQALPQDQKDRLQDAADTLESSNASAAMSDAAEQAARNITSAAQQRQQAARSAMEQALARLRGREGDSPESAEASPADSLARQLKQLAEQQKALRSQTGDINARRDPSGALDRAGQLRLGQAGKNQANLASQVQGAQRSAGGEAVQRLLTAVGGQMQTTSRDMQAGQSDQPVLDAQQHAADTLAALAEALDRAAQDKQSPSGASGQAQGQSGQPSQKGPPAAEIEALYLLQQDLLFRTQHASKTGAATPAVQQLAQEQQQVHDLAQRVLGQR